MSELAISNLQELSVAIGGEGFSPTLMTSEFLKSSGIVPQDWELARPPAIAQQGSQVSFRTGVSFTAHSNRITITESIGSKEEADIQAAGMARQLAALLPSARYRGLALSIRSFATTQELNGTSPRDYIARHLIATGPWQSARGRTAKATVQFVYPLDCGDMSLNVAEAQLRLPEAETIPVILFVGSVSTRIDPEGEEEPLQALNRQLDAWPSILQSYRELLSTAFLSTATADTPSLSGIG